MRTSNLKSTTRFFAEHLGLSVSYEGKGLVQFELPSGQLFEVFGSENRYYPLHNCPVLAFQVEDVRQARTELASKGSSSKQMSRAMSRRRGCTFAVPMASCMSFGKRPVVKDTVSQWAADRTLLPKKESCRISDPGVPRVAGIRR